jgi:hypothetical protein
LGSFRIVGLALRMRSPRSLLPIGGALMVSSFAFLLEAPVLFRVTFFVGAFILAFVAFSYLLRWFSNL